MDFGQRQQGVRIHPVSFVAGSVVTTALLAAALWAMAEVSLGYGMNCGTMYGPGAWMDPNAGTETKKCKDVISVTYLHDIGENLSITGSVNFSRGPEARGPFVDDECFANKQYSGGNPIVIGGVPVAQCDRRYVAKSVETECYSLPVTLQTTMKGIIFGA